MKMNICFLLKLDWQKWKDSAGEIADDTYEEYVDALNTIKQDMEAQGHDVVYIPFDEENFKKFCKEKKLPSKTPKEIIAARSAWAGFQRLTTLHCLRCGHDWYPRIPETPKQCPKCRSPYWDSPRKKGA